MQSKNAAFLGCRGVMDRSGQRIGEFWLSITKVRGVKQKLVRKGKNGENPKSNGSFEFFALGAWKKFRSNFL